MAATDQPGPILISGGHVQDPAQGIDKTADVLIEGGRISWIGEGDVPADAEVVDAAGRRVSRADVRPHGD
jgi:predicted amidohydrolase